MKNFNIKTYCAALCGFALLFGAQSCYREDMQQLYSRQYLTSVGLKDLQDLTDATNKQLKDLQLLIEKMGNKEPITKTEEVFKEIGGKQVAVGINLTFGDKTVYIPYGKDGANGAKGEKR